MGDKEPIEIRSLSALFLNCTGSTDVVDEDFASQTEGQLEGANYERREQGVNPYVESERIIFRRAAVLAASIHEGQGREAGGDYFESHLRGTVDNLVEVCGRTSCAVLGSGFLHDAPEDHGVRGERIEKMLLHGLDFDSLGSQEAARLTRKAMRRIGVLVDAMHKIRRGTKEETSLSTLVKLLRSMRDIGMDVPDIRLADRLHNVSDLQGIEEKKQMRVARETDEIHVRLADILGKHLMRNMLVDRSAAILNPNLFFGFQKLQTGRCNRDLVAKMNEVFDGEARAKYKLVDFPIYKPMPLAEFSVPLSRPITDIRLKDLDIHMATSLHEIEVIVEPDTNLEDVADFILKNFTKKSDRPERSDLFNCGILLEIRSVRHGIIRFRINNRIAEAKSKRGGCVESAADGESVQVDESGQRVRRIVSGIFQDAGDDEALIVRSAKERLLQPPITVYTPHGEPIILQRGAIVADFAEKIHSNFLVGFQGARQLFKRGSKPLGFFDKLEDGTTVELNPDCLTGESRDPDKIMVDPGCLLFLGFDAREALRERYLCRSEQQGDAFVIAERGRKYALKVANLFGITMDALLSAIRKSCQQLLSQSSLEASLEDQIMWHVGRGDIELLNLINESVFKTPRAELDGRSTVFWEINIFIPDVPLALDAFIKNFGPEQINMNNIKPSNKKQMKKAPPGTVGFKMTISDATGTKSSFDMMKFLLQMSYSHSVRVNSFSVVENTPQPQN